MDQSQARDLTAGNRAPQARRVARIDWEESNRFSARGCRVTCDEMRQRAVGRGKEMK